MPTTLTLRLSPSRPPARLQDLALLVRVPGTPAAVQAFTAAEHAEAEAYAAEVGGTIEAIPQPGSPTPPPPQD